LNTSIYKLENTDADLDPFIERVGDAHYVLLGEASHGTSSAFFSS
jgi:erythromycin esterase-like protein